MSNGPVNPVETKLLALRPIADGKVEITGGFWSARQRLNREVTIPYGMKMLEETGALENLRIAAGISKASYRLPLFRDSDLYKVLEAVAWERSHGVDPDQERFFDAGVQTIAAAQESDGYVNSYVQAVKGAKRFGDPAMGHELYCAGHLMQAAVADTRTRGLPGRLADIADRFAALLVEELPGKYADYVPGHPEIETALVELYRTNGDFRLVELAADLIERRGHGSLAWHGFGPSYFQDDVPFKKAMTIRGHAVRALYLLAGATDVYTESGEQQLLDPILAQWQDMTSAKTYLTGGVGSRHKDEAFGNAFELPPDRAYCETCAAIGSIMWNWRLLLLTGDATYAELMERTLYNGFLAGVGLDGTTFFYQNPLQSREPSSRSTWYDCACCPPNAMRLLSSLEHYVATCTEYGLQLHQYVSGRIRSEQGRRGAFELELATDYPFEGTVTVSVVNAPADVQDISLRVPTWADNVSCTLNNRPLPTAPLEKGYLKLRREWTVGDEMRLQLPLSARVITASTAIDAVRGCVAYERGPLVYCLEGIDLPEVNLSDVAVEASTVPEESNFEISGSSVVALGLDGRVREMPSRSTWPYQQSAPEDTGTRSRSAGEELRRVQVRATPYFAWANRGATSMRVWIPQSPVTAGRPGPSSDEEVRSR